MFNYILYRLGQFIALSLPLKLGYRVAVFICGLRYIFAYKDRKIVTENLKAIFPLKTSREIRKIRIAVFRNFAKYLIDFFRFERLNLEYVKENIKLENTYYIDKALSKGKGVIILSAHIGNWELGGVVVALLGYPFWAVALVHKHKRVNDFFNSQRASKGMKVIPLGRAVRASLDILKNNGVLALAGDRDFSERGIVVDFFGRPAILPQGPAALSLKTGASIVPGFMTRNNDDTFTLRFEEPFEAAAGLNKNDCLMQLIRRCTNIIENYIIEYPEQWYMFRQFWTG